MISVLQWKRLTLPRSICRMPTSFRQTFTIAASEILRLRILH
jgi:hypothetical protein